MLRKNGVVGKFVEYFGDGVSALLARRPRDARQHVARVRRDVRLLPRRRGHARLPAADGPRPSASRSSRRTARRTSSGATRRSTRLLARRRARPRRRRAEPRRPAPPAGPRAARRRRSSRSSTRSARSASTTRTARTTRCSSTRSPPPTRRARAARRRAELPDEAPVAHGGARRPPPACPCEGADYELDHGAVVIAAITSCTNTSNPSVMVAAGLLARNAVERGLHAQAVGQDEPRAGLEGRHRLLRAGGPADLARQARLQHVGYGCTTCIGNSGPLADEISAAIARASSSSARCSRATATSRAASTRGAGELPRVAAARRRLRARRPHGHRPRERAARPDRRRRLPARHLAERARDRRDDRVDGRARACSSETYDDVFDGDDAWRALPVPEGELFAWEPDSTYVRQPPYFEGMSREPGAVTDIEDARVLVVARRHGHDRPHLARRLDQAGVAGRPLPHRARRRAQGLQLVRRAPRQPRGHGARDVRQHPPAQQARPRHGGDVDGAPALRRGDDDLRRVAALPRGGGAARRARRQGVRLGLVARLGRQGAEAARRARRDRRELRAHPPLQPGGDGHPAAAVRRRRDARVARPHRPRALHDQRHRGRRGVTK